MPRDARFWRNVTIITVAHLALIIALVRWNRANRTANLPSIVWMNAGGAEATAPNPPPPAETAIEETSPAEADPPRSSPKKPDEPPVLAPTASDIQLPTATSSPVPIVTPPPKADMPVVKASPRPTAKPTPRATPKKKAVARATPKPLPKKKATPAEQKKKDDESKAKTKTGPADPKGVEGEKSGSTEPSAAVRAAEFSRYGKMLHDRFYSAWIQPTTSVAVGAKVSASVRIRIQKDGRVSNFTIVRPSGNVVVDESLAAVAKRVPQVDPLPQGLGNRAYYEVNINFELNPEP